MKKLKIIGGPHSGQEYVLSGFWKGLGFKIGLHEAIAPSNPFDPNPPKIMEETPIHYYKVFKFKFDESNSLIVLEVLAPVDSSRADVMQDLINNYHPKK